MDTGASIDILYWDTFKNMNLKEEDLEKCLYPIKGFGQVKIPVVGNIPLLVTLREGELSTTKKILFTIIRFTSAYNAILGRNTLHKFGIVSSSFHQCMKFQTPIGICCIKGSQSVARSYNISAVQCQDNAVWARKKKDLEVMQNSTPRYLSKKEESLPPMETTSVELEEGKKLKLGNNLSKERKEAISNILRQNLDIFAWDESKLKGIDSRIVEHKLGIDPKVNPIKQKLRVLGPAKKNAALSEINKLIKNGFIREIKYPRWISNIVMVKKSEGTWRMCIDFTSLNKFCPKDSYPLPLIDQLIDRSTGYELLSFMDAYSGYNQIPMCKKDEDKTSFISETGTFCYTKMSFGLKNAGAIFKGSWIRYLKDKSKEISKST